VYLKRILRNVRRGLDNEVGSDTQRQWSDPELVEYANEAVDEIIKELMCLTADDDFTETPAKGTITIFGTAGQISSVSVNGAVVTSGAVPFNGTLDQTAIDLASNINTFAASPSNLNVIKFTAQAATGGIVTISGPSGSGSTPNGYTIVAVVSGGISANSVAMSGGACLCKLFVIPGQSKYQLHPKTIFIRRFKPGNRARPLDPKTKEQLDAQCPGWESSELGLPFAYIPDFANKKITVVVGPSDADTITLDVVRLPYTHLDVDKPDMSPEIAEDYQPPIIPWMKRQAFLKNDAETLDLARSEKFEKEFYRMIEQIKAKLDNLREPPSQGISHYGMY
jgi:hypothetical protein